jgi:hypothetical protein
MRRPRTSSDGASGSACGASRRSPAQLAARPRRPLLTVCDALADRCYGHAAGMAGEDERGTAWRRWLPARVQGEAGPRRPPVSLASAAGARQLLTDRRVRRYAWPVSSGVRDVDTSTELAHDEPPTSVEDLGGQ